MIFTVFLNEVRRSFVVIVREVSFINRKVNVSTSSLPPSFSGKTLSVLVTLCK